MLAPHTEMNIKTVQHIDHATKPNLNKQNKTSTNKTKPQQTKQNLNKQNNVPRIEHLGHQWGPVYLYAHAT